MTAAHFPYPLQFHQSFISSIPPIIHKTHKPLYSISSNANKDDFFNKDNDKITTSSSSSSSNGGGKIRMPTAPWMKGPLLLQPNQVVDFSNPTNNAKPHDFDTQKVDKSLTERIRGRRGKKPLKRIVERIEKLEKAGILSDTHKSWGDFEGGFLMDQVESVDKSVTERIRDRKGKTPMRRIVERVEKHEKDGILIDTHKSWGDLGGGFLMDQLESVDNGDERSKFGRRMPWEREKGVVFRRVKKEKVEKGVELIVDKDLLERLRSDACKMRKWVKVNKAGVTQSVVDEIHSLWVNNELVMLKFDLPLCRNMDRAREIVEIKTGGLVVWSKKDSLVVYRGHNYRGMKRFRNRPSSHKQGFETGNVGEQRDMLSIGSTDKSLYEREGDRLLDGLGPRFVDWWYPKPLPVDGDLLPEVVPGFKPPFRLCLPNVRQKLTDDELAYLRNLARSLPVHFVLGRNSKLQGLGVAIVKLWERSIIAKIAVKWGVPNTNNELMATELKRLTGGVLLLRNKFFIIFYRGKDFLPDDVANMVVEREMELQNWQLREEDARLKAAETLNLNAEAPADTTVVGTLSEFHYSQTISENLNHFISEAEAKLEAEKEKIEKEIRKHEHKLAILKFKIEKAEKELLKLNLTWQPSEQEPDQEMMTEEERECFRKIGLKMDRVLVLGRRGVFDGVIEGLHQHWKHRELVKVITMQKTFIQVLYTARLLEKESGGILVSIDRMKKGHAIIIYRGKNYKRPIEFGGNLLDKRKALKRSLEMQRCGSLKFFAYQRQKEIAELQHKLADLEKKSDKTD